jgi:hypothetical protein
MPDIGLPLIVSLISAGVGGVSTGVGLYEQSQAPRTPQAGFAPPAAPLTAGQNAGQSAAVGQQLPNLQALTGGSLSPEYAAQFGAGGAGVSNNPQATGNIQQAINSFFGLAPVGSSGLTQNSIAQPSGGPGILDLLQRPNSGSSPLASGGGLPSWVQSVLGGNNFQGLQQG